MTKILIPEPPIPEALIDETPTPEEVLDEVYVFPMSFAQQRLWFLDQLEPGGASYNMPAAVRLTGMLHVAALEQSLNAIVERHESLRTTFEVVDEQPVQVIVPSLTIPLLVIDLQPLSADAQTCEVQRLAATDAHQPFNLVRGPLLRVRLLRLAATEHVLLLTLHHIISDGWSMGILIRELATLYAAFADGKPSPLPDLPIQYADFACWQHEWLTGDVREKQLNYWKNQLVDAPALLELPTDWPRPSVQTFRGKRHAFTLPDALSKALKRLSQQAGTTLFMTLLAAYKILLARYSNQQDILVGIPIANRNRQEVEPLIGCFVNTLVLRTHLDQNPSFMDFLAQVRQVTLDAHEHQDLPFEVLVDELQLARNLSHSPLFQVMLVWENIRSTGSTLFRAGAFELPDLTLTPLAVESTTAKFDLTLMLEESQQGLTGVWEYSTDLFEAATIVRMAGHFQTLLAGIVADPAQRIAQLPLLTATERHQLLVEWNTTAAPYPQDKCIQQLFEEQVERTPDAIALVYGNTQLTYRALNTRANQLAHYLQAQGVGPEVLVGVCCERSLELMVGILGVLKAGGAYVPLDPSYPQERLAFMLEDAQVKVLLTQQTIFDLRFLIDEEGRQTMRLVDPKSKPKSKIINLDSDWSMIAQASPAQPASAVTADNLAYVIYTSGSTGKPKGTQIIHRGLTNYLTWAIQTYAVAAGCGAPVHSSIGFDATITSFFAPLLVGKQVVLLPEQGEIEALSTLLQATEHFSLVKITPAHLEALSYLLPAQAAAQGARAFIIGGEALFGKQLTFWHTHAPHTRMINEYGPTETVVGCCVYEADASIPYAGAVPIGRPIANTQLYVLDAAWQPTPMGVPGELYIGGDGVARGYLNRPALTQEKFIPNPFGPGRLYKTGDLVRYLPDGNLVYLGRLDQQIKLRGFRIELGEIEAVLTQHSMVREAAVIVDETHGHKRLVAYLVSTQATLSVSDVRTFLADKLPDYMVPAAFVSLAAMPLTPNGKVDRRALPALEAADLTLATNFVPPRTLTEQILAKLWSDVLRINLVGIHDNFFELGGDSILSIQVVSRARQSGVYLTPKQLFQHQTIAGLASVAGTGQQTVAEQGLVTGSMPLTPIQHWFFGQASPEPHHYNQSVLLEVAPELSPELLEQAVRHLLLHHDALRLRFQPTATGWQQEYAAPDASVPFSVIDLSDTPVTEQTAALEAAATALQASLNLAEGPLVQVALIRLGANRLAQLLFVIHHLAVDGVSWQILLEDLATICQQLQRNGTVQLPSKTTSFQTWAQHLTEYAHSVALDNASAHWLALLQSTPPTLPVDYPVATVHDNTIASVATVTRALSVEQTRALLQTAPAIYHTQINDLLLTALTQAFAQWTGVASLFIDLEGHGRQAPFEQVDLSRTVGWFTSIYPVQLELTTTEPAAAIKAIKEQLRRVPNGGIGYGVLRYLRRAEQWQQQPQAQVKFNYLSQLDNLIGKAQATSLILGLAPESTGAEQSPLTIRSHWLDVTGIVIDWRLQIAWDYSTNLHKPATIEQLATGFHTALTTLIAHCQTPDAGGYTPSDFPLARVDQPTLDRLVGHGRQVEDLYPLSPMQQGMLFHTLLSPTSGVYVEQMTTQLHGPLDVAKFRQAWQQVVARYAVLRTAFHWEALEQPLQLVHRAVQLPWQEYDWQTLPSVEQAERLQALLAADREQGFDLGQPPLMRCMLIQLALDAYQFVWSYHHLLLDGWGRPLILKAVLAAYTAKGATVATPRPYRSYIAWLQQQDMAQAKVYWQQALQGFSAPTPLVVDRSAEVEQRAAYTELVCPLPTAVSATLQGLARQNHITLNTFIQGAWALLLSRYSGQTDVLFGTTVSGRPPELPEVEAMVGLFINTLPVRVQVIEDMPLLPWLQALQSQQTEREQFAYSPLVEIQGWSEVPRGTPLFESIVVFENYPVDETLLAGEGLSISQVQSFEQTNYPLAVIAAPGEELGLALNYDRRRFDAETMRRMSGHLHTLLTAMATNPDQRLVDFPLLTAAEWQQLTVDWNATAVVYAQAAGKCAHELFAEQAARTPHAVALVYRMQQLTYGELNCRANQLAHYLMKQGVGPETIVGVSVERSLEMLVSVLGVLKAGAAYAPLDPSYPKDRLAFMLADSQAPVLLTQKKWVAELPQTAHVICVDMDPAIATDWNQIALESTENPVSGAQPHNLAYLIYTSGSTGKPKGVLIQHESLVDHCFTIINQHQHGPASRVLLFVPLSFDQSVEDIFPTLLSGARLVLPPAGPVLSLGELIALFEHEGVTLVHLPTAYWHEWMTNLAHHPAPDCIGKIKVGGETVPLEPFLIMQQKVPPKVKFANGYGPTEITITSHIYEPDGPLDPSVTSVPIGRTLANTLTYILDAHKRPVPLGVPGELYIGGARVGRGYKDRPELTAERFITNPFGAGRLYKTGDQVRYLPAPFGRPNLEFLGRIDNQVKLRGFRIELGEIEAVLNQHPAVRMAAVVARGEATNKRLVAYLCPIQKPVAANGLRTFLAERLPDYMVPTLYVWLDAMPVTPSGKIDRRALPAPEATDTAINYLAPRDALEQQLAALWSEVLTEPTVGIEDNFFDAGGHSLLAIRLMALIQQRFGQQLPLATLFDHPSIAQLADYLRQSGTAGDWSPLVAIQSRGNKLPFFCIHGGGGNVLHYYELARHLGTDQPFYALQAIGLDGRTAPYTSIEAMAAHYIASIQTVQPCGPYRLGGHSLGGHIAYEMAQQLQQAGHAVALVAVMDTFAPGGKASAFGLGWDDARWVLELTDTIERFLGVSLKLEYTALQPLLLEEQLTYVNGHLQQLNLLPPGTGNELLRGLLQVFKANNQIDYTPKISRPMPIVLLRGSESTDTAVKPELRSDPTWGWHEFAAGPVDLHFVPGDHISMMMAPHVQLLAEQLGACLANRERK